MEGIKVKELLNAVVRREIKRLHEAMVLLKQERVEFRDEDAAPMLNLKADDGHYVNWVIRAVVNSGETTLLNAHLPDCPYRPEEEDRDCNAWFDCNDRYIIDSLIPGELTELASEIVEITPID